MARLAPVMGFLLPLSNPLPLVGGLPLGTLPSSSPMDSYPGLCQSPFLDSRLVSMLNLLGQSLLSLPSSGGHAKGRNLGLLGAAIAAFSSAPFIMALLCSAGQWPGDSGHLTGVRLGIPALCDSLPLRPRERGGFFSPEPGEPDSPWTGSGGTTPSTPTTPTTEGEGDGLSYNQRSLQRWEKDEELGQLSTISPVLYANINFPNLKQDYPGTHGMRARGTVW